jgi:hypothetical protein
MGQIGGGTMGCYKEGSQEAPLGGKSGQSDREVWLGPKPTATVRSLDCILLLAGQQ